MKKLMEVDEHVKKLMIKGYLLPIEEIKKIPDKFNSYENIKKDKEKLAEEVKKIFEENKIIDGDKLEELFFPESEKEYDFFISYSHNDEDIVKKLASYLEYNGAKVFLDSKIWGSADYLLELIDKTYSINDWNNNFFDYKKRNFSTSHVHSMLNSAIGKAILKSKNIIFTSIENTTNTNLSTSELEVKILSPWIYQELRYFNLFYNIQSTLINLFNLVTGMESIQDKIEKKLELKISREVNISNLTKITREELEDLILSSKSKK